MAVVQQVQTTVEVALVLTKAIVAAATARMMVSDRLLNKGKIVNLPIVSAAIRPTWVSSPLEDTTWNLNYRSGDKAKPIYRVAWSLLHISLER